MLRLLLWVFGAARRLGTDSLSDILWSIMTQYDEAEKCLMVVVKPDPSSNFTGALWDLNAKENKSTIDIHIIFKHKRRR